MSVAWNPTQNFSVEQRQEARFRSVRARYESPNSTNMTTEAKSEATTSTTEMSYRPYLSKMFRSMRAPTRSTVQEMTTNLGLGPILAPRPTLSRCAFAVTCGVYYYEVTPPPFATEELASRVQRFGWATRQAFFDRSSVYEIGDSEHSISLSLEKRAHAIWHRHQRRTINNYKLSKSADQIVVGCLIDADQREFHFYINGEEAQCIDSEQNRVTHYSDEPYYAAWSVAPAEELKWEFNFGAKPFKCPPANRFTTFYEKSGHDEKRYQILEGENIFKQPVINCEFEPCFRSATQDAWDEYVRQFIAKIRTVEHKRTALLTQIQYKIFAHFRRAKKRIPVEKRITLQAELEWRLFEGNAVNFLRLIQSLIEILGKEDADDELDLIAYWVGALFWQQIELIGKERLRALSELLYPYLLQPTDEPKLKYRHRVLCIVLLELIKLGKQQNTDYIGDIQEEMVAYLTGILKNTDDESTRYFGLLALEDAPGFSAEDKRALYGKSKVKVMLREWRKCNTDSVTNKELSGLKNRRKFCAEWIATQMASDSNSGGVLSSIWPFNSKPKYEQNLCRLYAASKDAKLSPNGMIVRSDRNWQSARSDCHTNFGQAFYYEVCLHSSGPAYIGWSTERTSLNDDNFRVGTDRFSIGYNGFQRRIWHKDRQLWKANNRPQWTAGDVVGCLVDCGSEKKRFCFFLNGKLAYDSVGKLQLKVHFSDQPYYPSVSVGQHQQVEINLGGRDFSYAPKDVRFCNFHLEAIRKGAIQK